VDDLDRKGIHLIVVPADHGATVMSFVASLVAGSDDIVGDGPRIVAINRAGRQFIVQQFTSLKKAEKALAPMQSELSRLGADAWCQAHKVPSDFETWGQKSGR
jgi:hypothetical protein